MSNEDARKLFVAGLPDSVTEEDLRGLFLESGAQSAELTLPRDRMSGRPRGFAFVRLGSEEEADRARSVLDGRIVDGRTISVRPFQAEPPARGERPAGGGFGAGPGGGGYGAPREDRPRRDAGGPAPDRTLYVGNLPYDATQEEIEALLNELGAGPVARVHLPLDQDGRKRGFGFVTLATAEAANAAIDQLKNAELRSRRLIINLAHPKGSPGAPTSGGPGGFAPSGDRPAPRTFGPPSSNFGPPSPPGGRTGLGNQRKRKEGEGDGRGRPGATGAGGGGGGGGRRDREERNWRGDDDDE